MSKNSCLFFTVATSLFLLNSAPSRALNPPFQWCGCTLSHSQKKILLLSPGFSLVRLLIPLPFGVTLSYLTFLSSTLPTWEDNSPTRRASIIHVSPASSGLSLLNIVFIPSKYPLNLSFFHAKIALVIFFLHSFPSIRSTISTCMGAYLLSFLVHFLPYVLSSSNHLESILQPAEYFISIITHENSSIPRKTHTWISLPIHVFNLPFSLQMIPLVNFLTKI